MQIKNLPQRVDDMKRELQKIRKASLLATREGDYRKIAHLTVQASTLNRAIMEAEGLIQLSPP